MQYKMCLVGELGLHEHEVQLVSYILRSSNARAQMRYEWARDVSQAHLVIVNADNEAAMREWQHLAGSHPDIVILLITQKAAEGATEYFLSRPLSPTKMLAMLDQIFRDRLASVLGEHIFSGEVKTSQRDILLASQVDSFSATSRVLVVDDSPTVRKQLEQELAIFNLQVDFAESGEQCLDMLQKTRYDIVFLDVVMPGADGYEVCKSIRKNQETKQLPVIMLTSKSSSFDRVRGTLSGCNSYLIKPVNYEKFHKVLLEHLARA